MPFRTTFTNNTATYPGVLIVLPWFFSAAATTPDVAATARVDRAVQPTSPVIRQFASPRALTLVPLGVSRLMDRPRHIAARRQPNIALYHLTSATVPSPHPATTRFLGRRHRAPLCSPWARNSLLFTVSPPVPAAL